MNASRDEILARLRAIFGESFEIESARVTPDARLREDLDLDSIDAIDLAVRLEEETALKLDDEELRGVRRVADVVELVHAKLADRQARAS
ncbi:MAG TPA: acyl carrier protein [Myxococcota bacterium]|nr:acyl carrier protein [Myxococcota bacterium]